MHSQRLTASAEPQTPALRVRDTTTAQAAAVRDLYWLRNLVDELQVLGLVEHLEVDRLLLHVSQAQVNDLQGRDRNSGVVSRRCSRLRGHGVLESSSPLVVRADLLPPPLSPSPSFDAPAQGHQYRGHHAAGTIGSLPRFVRRTQSLEFSPETVLTPQKDVDTDKAFSHDNAVMLEQGGDAVSCFGSVPYRSRKPATSATTRHLADALRLACSQLQWDLARRITALIEVYSRLERVPTDYPRVPRDPRDCTRVGPRVGPRDQSDDDENSSSSITSHLTDAVSRGKTRDIAPRADRAMAVFRFERADLTSNQDHDAAMRRTGAVEDGDYADQCDSAVSSVGTGGYVPAGSIPAEGTVPAEGSIPAEGTVLDAPTLLHLVEPLRSVCRSRQLPDLDDVEVLRRAFDGWDGSAVSTLVGDLVSRVETGVKIRSPFGLLVTLARRGTPDRSGMSCVTDNGATGSGSVTTTVQGSQSEMGEPAQLRKDSRLERLRVLTGWVDIDADSCCDDAPSNAPVIRTRIEQLRGMLNRPTDAALVDVISMT